MPLSTIYQFIVEASFIGGGNRSIWRKPQTCKSLTNYYILFYRVQDSNSQLQWRQALCIDSCKSNQHMITTAPKMLMGKMNIKVEVIVIHETASSSKYVVSDQMLFIIRAEWWVYWNTLVCPSVPKPCVRNQSFVFCWILFIFGVLVGHDPSMCILYTDFTDG